MVGPVFALALLALPHPFAGHSDQKVERTRVMGWQVEAVHDQFDGRTSCTVERGGIAYRHGVVTFSFGRGVNTAAAQFRVDDGPVQEAALMGIEVASLGAQLYTGNLRNPSNGLVRIPATLLTGARQVLIRPDANSVHRVFALNGLSEALGAARSKGCDVV